MDQEVNERLTKNTISKLQVNETTKVTSPELEKPKR